MRPIIGIGEGRKRREGEIWLVPLPLPPLPLSHSLLWNSEKREGKEKTEEGNLMHSLLSLMLSMRGREKSHDEKKR